MRVMYIRDVRMDVVQGFVLMNMAVRPRWQGVVRMVVMAVVVLVGVFVLAWLMNMFVGVGFCEMKQHAQQHQQPAAGHQPTG